MISRVLIVDFSRRSSETQKIKKKTVEFENKFIQPENVDLTRPA